MQRTIAKFVSEISHVAGMFITMSLLENVRSPTIKFRDSLVYESERQYTLRGLIYSINLKITSNYKN